MFSFLLYFTFYCILHRIYCKHSVDPDQTPHSATSKQGLHCLHTNPKEASGLKRVKTPSPVVQSIISLTSSSRGQLVQCFTTL